jgi:hypothetical protein
MGAGLGCGWGWGEGGGGAVRAGAASAGGVWAARAVCVVACEGTTPPRGAWWARQRALLCRSLTNTNKGPTAAARAGARQQNEAGVFGRLSRGQGWPPKQSQGRATPFATPGHMPRSRERPRLYPSTRPVSSRPALVVGQTPAAPSASASIKAALAEGPTQRRAGGVLVGGWVSGWVSGWVLGGWVGQRRLWPDRSDKGPFTTPRRHRHQSPPRTEAAAARTPPIAQRPQTTPESNRAAATARGKRRRDPAL